jgi:membrane protease YdiL (CAAX protease family)
MKKTESLEIVRSIVFFVLVWIIAYYVRAETLKQLDTFAQGAGKVVGLAYAIALGLLKFYSWTKARGRKNFRARLWRLVPWTIGIAAPAGYVLVHFFTAEDLGVLDWLSLIIELIVPVGALLFAYLLLSSALFEKSSEQSEP